MPDYKDYAEYYDLDQSEHLDIAFCRSYAEANGPRTLELACGTGRVLVPLAESGVQIDGLDFSGNMLALCREKLAVKGMLGGADLFLSDMADFDLPFKAYGLIYVPVRSFMHLFTQQAQLGCLRCAYGHLRPGGAFIVDVYAPASVALMQAPNAPFNVTKEYDLPSGNHVVRSDRFVSNDPVMQIQHCERRFREVAASGALVRERVVPMDTRYTFRYELDLLLEKVGFRVTGVYRDYDKRPFDGAGEIIMVGRKPE